MRGRAAFSRHPRPVEQIALPAATDGHELLAARHHAPADDGKVRPLALVEAIGRGPDYRGVVLAVLRREVAGRRIVAGKLERALVGEREPFVGEVGTEKQRDREDRPEVQRAMVRVPVRVGLEVIDRLGLAADALRQLLEMPTIGSTRSGV